MNEGVFVSFVHGVSGVAWKLENRVRPFLFGKNKKIGRGSVRDYNW